MDCGFSLTAEASLAPRPPDCRDAAATRGGDARAELAQSIASRSTVRRGSGRRLDIRAKRAVIASVGLTRIERDLLYVQAPASMRRIVAVEGLDALRADPEVGEIVLSRGAGRSVHWPEGNHGHVFSVRGAVADHRRLARMERRVREEVHVRGDC